MTGSRSAGRTRRPTTQKLTVVAFSQPAKTSYPLQRADGNGNGWSFQPRFQPVPGT